MKISIRVIQVLVAVLFIISGLVKANDPLGLSYKMEEFFEIWNSGLNSGDFFAKGMLVGLFNFLHNYSLALSIIMITLEIVAGIALLIGWRLCYGGLFKIAAGEEAGDQAQDAHHRPQCAGRLHAR